MAFRQREAAHVTFREVFSIGQFRAAFSALGLSTMGDFLARGAIAITVYDQTGSAGLIAVTYAITFLPDVLGGPLLSGLADRFPRRRVMVLADVGRAALIALITVWEMPLLMLWLLLVGVRLMDAPFRSAHTAVLTVILTGDRYVIGLGACHAMAHLGLALGFVAAGVVVQWLGTGQALAINAATFLLSALVVRLGVHDHPAADSGSAAERGGEWRRSLTMTVRYVRRHQHLNALMAFAIVPGIGMVTIGLAVPYAVENGASTAVAGLLMASGSAGTAIGTWGLTRFIHPKVQIRLLGPLAVLSSAPLVIAFAKPWIVVTLVLWFARGVAFCFWTPVTAAVIQSVPNAMRGQISGLLTAVLRASQGAFVLLYGWAAEFERSSTVITVAGVVGVGVAFTAAAAWRRASKPTPSTE